MSGEPDLYRSDLDGTCDEWVTYLQQVMAQRGEWHGEADGMYTQQLAEAVYDVQLAAGIDPADGDVRESTWAYLLSDPSATAQESEAPVDNGVVVDPSADVGMPTFQYTMPTIPLAEGVTATPAVTCTQELTLTGTLKIEFQQSVPGLTAQLNDSSFRQSAGASLGPLTENVSISGIGTDSPTITGSVGVSFDQNSVEYVFPNTLKFKGTADVDYDVDTPDGPAKVTGALGYSLAVSCLPNAVPAPEPVDEPAWYEVWADELLAVGAVVLVVGVGIALAPETGGASLIPVLAL